MEQMAHNGDTDLMEERAVEKFLCYMPKKYAQIIISIETLLDFEQLTIEDVIGRLKTVQDREQAPNSEHDAAGGKLLYMMEQWRAFDKKKEEGSSSFGSKERRRRPRGGKKEEQKGPWGQVGADGCAVDEPKATRDDTCNNCGRTGHWAKDCRLSSRHGGQAHVAQAEETPPCSWRTSASSYSKT